MAALALSGLPATAQVRVPVEPLEPGETTEWIAGPARKRACIDATAIAGAVVVDPKTLELADRAGQRFRLIFDRPCPHLGFYGGFYYVPDKRGQLCASRDQLLGRSGAACPIAAVSEMRRRR
ncbi:hypothetical protein [Thermaurantiacus sp.]